MKEYSFGSGLKVKVSRVLTSQADIDTIVDLEQPGQGTRTNRVLLGTAEWDRELVGYYAYYFLDEDGVYVSVFNPDKNNQFDPNQFLVNPDAFSPVEIVSDGVSVKQLEKSIVTIIAESLRSGVEA